MRARQWKLLEKEIKLFPIHAPTFSSRELGIAQRELARRLGMTQPGVGYAFIKGEAISKSNNYRIKN
jgi:hypothetical protein